MNNRSITKSRRHFNETLKPAWRFRFRFALLLGDLYKQFYCARKGTIRAYKVSTGVMLSHPGHLPLLSSRPKFCDLLDYRKSQTQRRVNAFIMSGLSFPPNARFVLLCHHVTPPYSARRRLPR